MITLIEATYFGDYSIKLSFDTGESSVVDFLPIIKKHPQAIQLLQKEKFRQFHLDSWPTIVWDCGLDLSPEYLYELATGNGPAWQRESIAANG
jgi:hypothetical protein